MKRDAAVKQLAFFFIDVDNYNGKNQIHDGCWESIQDLIRSERGNEKGFLHEFTERVTQTD